MNRGVVKDYLCLQTYKEVRKREEQKKQVDVDRACLGSFYIEPKLNIREDAKNVRQPFVLRNTQCP